jgi:hypothetical protein
MLRQITKKLIQNKAIQRTQQLQQQLSLNRLNNNGNNNCMMMIRSMSSISATYAKAATPSPTTPTIADVIVELTFVDPKGARRKVKGMVGTYRNNQ